MRRHLALLAAVLALSGCATNPVTGKKELNMVSEAQEIQIGEQQYGPRGSRRAAITSRTRRSRTTCARWQPARSSRRPKAAL